jgi:AcrR family transcriptional regulator
MNVDAPALKENQARLAGRQRDPAIDKAILKTAFELFLKQGVEGVNFEQLAKRTGISRATIYRRWKSRKDILNAALQSGKPFAVPNPEQILKLPPRQFLRFLEDAIVSGMMNPLTPRLIMQLIGALATHPELLSTYYHETLEPGWQTLFKAVGNGCFPSVCEPDLLRDLLTGAIIHRVVFRAAPPEEREERRWVRRLLRQTGLTDLSARPDKKRGSASDDCEDASLTFDPSRGR